MTETNMLDSALRVAGLALALGRVSRATYHEDGQRRETDTDHTVMLAMLVIELVTQAPDLDVDLGTAVRFALVHDLVEAYAGDTVSVSLTPEQRREKDQRESAALQQLRDEFGPRHWIVASIEAYERMDTREARLVNYLDKVTPKLTHIRNGGVTMTELGLDVTSLTRAHLDQHAHLQRRSPDMPEASELFLAAHEATLRVLSPTPS